MADEKCNISKNPTEKDIRTNQKICRSMWLLQIMAVIICLHNLALFFQDKDFFSCNSIYDILMYRKKFWIAFQSHTMAAVAVILIAAVCFHAMAAWHVKKNRVLGVYLSIAADIAALAVLAGYPVLVLYCSRSYIIPEYDTIIYFSCLGILFLMLLVHLYVYKKYKEFLSREYPKYEKIILTGLGCAVIAAAAFLDICGFGDYLAFKNNYGIYGKIDHERNTELEDDWGNHRNGAVNAEGNIYYRDYIGNQYVIMEIDESKKQQIFYELDKDQGEIREICYDQGFIYANIYDYGNDSRIIRIDTDTKNTETIAETDYILTMEIKDHYLYYESENFEDPDLTYSGGRSSYIYDIYRISLNGTTGTAKQELYIGSVDGRSGDTWRDFYIVYMYDYYDYDAVSDVKFQRYQQYYGDYTYVLTEGDYGAWGKDAWLIEPTDLLIGRDGTEKRIENVTDYNIYDGVLYYAVLTDDGAEVYAADLSGSNARIIAGYSDILSGHLLVGDHVIACVLTDRDVDRKVEIIDK